MWFAIIFVLGLVVGGIITSIIFKRNAIGSLKAVRDEDDVYFFMELSTSPSLIPSKKYVTLKVDITQK